ncbi:MAG: glycoside hydrolase family 32 protein [Chitinophagaceae bacterium]
MKSKLFLPFIYCTIVMLFTTSTIKAQKLFDDGGEVYRPKVHFTPGKHWMNDPNGMVYYKGIYHLFFQYHPYSSVWGPMHWGHATSQNLVTWKQEPIAIYPDSIGTIFSGSAVVDKNNTSGFGKNGRPPLVAIFTQHNTAGEKAGSNNFQTQSLAYSNDAGKTWTKYSGNPVLKNPGITDFRDPKLMWYAAGKKWIMTLATKDRISFYSATDLKTWKKESEFGASLGAHGGVWECPDLLEMNDNGKRRWVLLVNLNPGGPNGGSGTQYFIGDFDGKNFTTDQTTTKWMDYGPDNYAGVTWSNTGNRTILIGWMSNWLYANKVPTEKWRNAMTIPRDLRLQHSGGDVFVASRPVQELTSISGKTFTAQNLKLNKTFDLRKLAGKTTFPARLKLTMDAAKDFSVVFSKSLGEELVLGYDALQNQYFIDRTKSGKTEFQKDFAGKFTAPRLNTDSHMSVDLVIDVTSIELFADDGLTLMTSIFFPNKPYDRVQIKSADNTTIKKLDWIPLKR